MLANPLRFFREVRQEVTKVTWPTRKETYVSTLMVFIMVALMSVFFFLSDVVIQWVIGFILGIGG